MVEQVVEMAHHGSGGNYYLVVLILKQRKRKKKGELKLTRAPSIDFLDILLMIKQIEKIQLTFSIYVR